MRTGALMALSLCALAVGCSKPTSTAAPTSTTVPTDTETPSGPATDDADEGPVVEVDPAHQRCQADGDCVSVMTQCSCHCGVAVHKDHLDAYQQKRDQACVGYQGRMCKMKCEDVPRCTDGKCVLAPPS